MFIKNLCDIYIKILIFNVNIINLHLNNMRVFLSNFYLKFFFNIIDSFQKSYNFNAYTLLYHYLYKFIGIFVHVFELNKLV